MQIVGEAQRTRFIQLADLARSIYLGYGSGQLGKFGKGGVSVCRRLTRLIQIGSGSCSSRGSGGGNASELGETVSDVRQGDALSTQR